MKAFFDRLQLLRVVGFVLAWAAISPLCFAQAPDTAKILETAAKGAGQARYEAIDQLGENDRDGAAVVPQLRKFLADKDPQVRWRSARSLADFGELAKAAAPELRKLLSDKNPIVQYHAAAALGRIGDRSDETTRALVGAATGKDGRVARAAIAALRHLRPGPKHVAAALVKVLKSDDQAVVLHAMEAIVALGAEAAPLLNEALQQPETVYLACTAIEHIGPDAKATVPALTKLLSETRHSHLLIEALLALASIGPAAQGAENAILPLLEMPTDATVPVAAAYALGAIGAKDADGPLRQALAKDEPFLQMVAAWALAEIHPADQALTKQAVDKLVHGLGSDDAQIRTAAAKGLQMLKAPPELVAPTLMTVANDPDPNVSANVVSALAGLGESVVPRATKALQNPEYRGLAVRVLTRLGPKASGAVEPLIAAMPEADPDFRAEIQFALAAIGPAAAPATGALAEAISSSDQRVRESALFALREIGPAAQAAAPALIEKMQADGSFDALAAAWALARIVPDDANVAAKALPTLTGGLSSSDEQVRLESAEALAAWGPAAKGAGAALTRAAEQDGSAAVRAAAEEALRRIARQR